MTKVCRERSDDCSDDGAVKCQDLCQRHYNRAWRRRSITTRKHNTRPRKANPGEGWCSVCSQFKPASAFTLDSKRADGLKGTCRVCVSEQGKQKYDAEKDWARRVLREYGLTAEGYKNLLDAQAGLCAICREGSEQRLHVDHCHATGRVRGLLCFRCNATLGKVEDSVDLLHQMITYLEMKNV